MREDDGRRRRWGPVAVAVPVALVTSGLLVLQASRAVVTTSAQAGLDSWTAGTVTLSEDGSGSALFTVGGLHPGDTGARCIVVTYGGNLPAAVRLYVSTSAGGLRPYLDLTIEEGTGGAGDCTGFAPTATLTGPGETVDSFVTAHGSFAAGVSGWTPDGAGPESRTYRFTYALQSNDAAQGQAGSATFRWQAQNA